MANKKIVINNVTVNLKGKGTEQYISLTDIAKIKNADNPADVIKNWLRTDFAIEFMGLWERMNNPNAKLVEIDQFEQMAGKRTFTMSPQKWIAETNAIGITSASGNKGGTFAHSDIAMEFASWISAQFKLYLVTEFQRLKKQEQLSLGWTAQRELAKLSYRLQTDAVKENLIVPNLTPQQISIAYASEADLLNVALFGMTANEFAKHNHIPKGNMRDNASLEQLLVLSQMESYNAILIAENIPQNERLVKLNAMAKKQLTVLLNSKNPLLLNK